MINRAEEAGRKLGEAISATVELQYNISTKVNFYRGLFSALQTTIMSDFIAQEVDHDKERKREGGEER